MMNLCSSAKGISSQNTQQTQSLANNICYQYKEEIIKNQQIQDKETFEKTKQQLKEQGWTQEAIDNFEKMHNNKAKEEYTRLKNLSSKETKVLALKSMKESIEILKKQAEDTSLSETERMEAKATAQYLDEQIKEVVQNKNVDQKIVQQAEIDVNKYQTPDNQEKMSESNEPSATTQEADKVTDNKSPDAPKVPNENGTAVASNTSTCLTTLARNSNNSSSSILDYTGYREYA